MRESGVDNWKEVLAIIKTEDCRETKATESRNFETLSFEEVHRPDYMNPIEEELVALGMARY